MPTIDGYRVDRLLGRGGFGAVYAGVRLSDSISVALKVVSAEAGPALKSLAREAEALADLGPPSTPQLYEHRAVSDGSAYIASSIAAGRPLSDVLEEHESGLPLDQWWKLAKALLNAVQAAHRGRWLHLDLKPENIFVDSEFSLTLIDWGTAQQVGGAHGAGAVLGTPEYMSPEQCEANPVNERSDVYALGILLYEALVGRTPFWGLPSELHRAHLTLRPPRPSSWPGVSVPAGVGTVILKCLAKSAARRYGSAQEIWESLDSVRAEVSTSSAVVSAAPGKNSPAKVEAQKKSVALLFVRDANVATDLRTLAQQHRGQIAHLNADQGVVLWVIEESENPVAQALEAALSLSSAGKIPRCLVHVAMVSVGKRPDGTVRFTSALFNKNDFYPTAGWPEGVATTKEARTLLPGIQTVPVPDRADLAVIDASAHQRTQTRLEIGVKSLTPLWGRQSALEAAMALANTSVTQTRPVFLTFLGEPGVGRTAFLTALGARVAVGSSVMPFRARRMQAGESDELLLALVSRILKLSSQPNPDEARAQMALLVGGTVSAKLWPAVAHACGWTDAEVTQMRSLAQVPGALRHAVAQSVGELLRARSETKPVCVLIDDAHFASQSVLDALEYAALAEASRPIAVCVTARDDFAQGRPGWGERAAQAETVVLEPLDEAAAEALCRHLLLPAEDVPLEVIRRISGRARGNPQLLVELVRALKEDGFIQRREQGSSFRVNTEKLESLPNLASAQWVAHRSLQSLPGETLAHARLVARLGSSFRKEEVEGVFEQVDSVDSGGDFPLDALVGLKQLVDYGVLTASKDGRYEFRMELVRDVVADGTSAALREKIHQAAVRYYEAERRTQPAYLAPLAHHLEMVGRIAEAGHSFLEMATQLQKRHEYLSSELMYARSLRLLPETDLIRRLAGFRGRGTMRYRLARYEDSRADFAAARTIARTLEDVQAEAEVLLDEGTALDWMVNYPASKQCLEEATRLSERLPNNPLEARIALGEGRSFWRNSQPKEAAAPLRRAAQVAGDDYETKVAALNMLSSILPEVMGVSEESRLVMEELTQLTESRGDKLHFAGALLNSRNFYVAAKQVDTAIDTQLRAIRAAREIGNVMLEYFAEYNLGEMYYQLAAVEDAWAHVNRAVGIEQKHPELASRPVALLLQARLMAFADDPNAQALADKISAFHAAAEAAGRVQELLLPNEKLLLQAVKLYLSRAPLAEWEPVLMDTERYSVEHEPVEILDLCWASAIRRKDLALAKEIAERTLRKAQLIANLMAPRLSARETELAALEKSA